MTTLRGIRLALIEVISLAVTERRFSRSVPQKPILIIELFSIVMLVSLWAPTRTLMQARNMSSDLSTCDDTMVVYVGSSMSHSRTFTKLRASGILQASQTANISLPTIAQPAEVFTSERIFKKS
jgi:hypothetical protein